MSSSTSRRVLAIGMDAAEPTMVRRMTEAGELPVLASLLAQGSWSRVTSDAPYSSGAVWPSFATGVEACDHGMYGLWNWDPAAMGMKYSDAGDLEPFWKELAGSGATVGVLDVPFAPFIGLTEGFEVSEYGPHDRVQGVVRVSPESLADLVATAVPPHPFAHPLARPPMEPDQVSRFMDQCLTGVRQRGDLAHRLVTTTHPEVTVVVFPESHHGGHFLWHTLDPEIPMYADLPAAAYPGPTLADVYREIDSQIGRLLEATGPETTVLVFALHGMEPARGVPSLLEPLLDQLGLTALAPEAGRSLLSTLKSRVPAPLRNIYRRSVPLAKRSQWGRSAVLAPYDWSRTRAFALPIEHEGHIRVNLIGREAQGIVPPEEYDATCEAIEAALHELRTADGRPVARLVIRPPRGTHPAGLPDLVVHWEPAAFESPVMVDGRATECIRREQTGQHSLDGFCLSNDPTLAGTGDGTIAAQDLPRLISAALRR
jgi:predicted AlkP superfamily phosphohydrolase/phosphomutase